MPKHHIAEKVNVPPGWENICVRNLEGTYFCPACSAHHKDPRSCRDPDAQAIQIAVLQQAADEEGQATFGRVTAPEA